jgi:metal-responsive CopG/Arc/MetJ family transcriptional regulator
MKTAVSIPDALFRAAEALAKQRRWSRSELYARALAEFLDSAQTREVTERLNAVYAKESSDPNAGWSKLQADAIGRDDGW